MSVQPRILKLRLLTAVPLVQMKRFYHALIGLPVLAESSDHLTLAAGHTKLTFIQAAPEQGKPFYHFAFNIPQNKLMKARDWLLARTPLIESPPNRRDPHYPDDVRAFPTWNAHALFFFDPADNIVEFIARHELQNNTPGSFTGADVQYASEIGFVVENQHIAAAYLKKHLALEPYPMGTNDWWAMGDAQGLLLCTPKGRIWGENTERPKVFDVFPTEVTISGGKFNPCILLDYPYQIIVE